MQNLNGFQPRVWGPPLWFFLHIVSVNFPVRPTVEQQMEYYTFFKSLGYVLPCKHCREAYAEWTKSLTLSSFASRSTLSKWVYDLHNRVNYKLGKTSGIPSYPDVLQFYEQFRGGDSNPDKYKAQVVLHRFSR
jgi:hypothetical protein